MVLGVRHFQAAIVGPRGAGRWLAQYDGRFACRQYEIYADVTLVAPYDIPFVDLDKPSDVPAVASACPSTLGQFDAVEDAAHTRRTELAGQRVAPDGHVDVRYFRASIPEETTEYGPGIWCAEFADGIARRQFEVYQDHTLVAPHDCGLADQFDEVVSNEHYEEITLAEFESLWGTLAMPRLRQIVDGSPP